MGQSKAPTHHDSPGPRAGHAARQMTAAALPPAEASALRDDWTSNVFQENSAGYGGAFYSTADYALDLVA